MRITRSVFHYNIQVPFRHDQCRRQYWIEKPLRTSADKPGNGFNIGSVGYHFRFEDSGDYALRQKYGSTTHKEQAYDPRQSHLLGAAARFSRFFRDGCNDSENKSVSGQGSGPFRFQRERPDYTTLDIAIRTRRPGRIGSCGGGARHFRCPVPGADCPGTAFDIP